jgi:hypothetical protein
MDVEMVLGLKEMPLFVAIAFRPADERFFPAALGPDEDAVGMTAAERLRNEGCSFRVFDYRDARTPRRILQWIAKKFVIGCPPLAVYRELDDQIGFIVREGDYRIAQSN